MGAPVKVNVSLAQPGVTVAGFGTPLVLTQETPLSPGSWTTRTRFYEAGANGTILQAIAADWSTSSAAYSAAAQACSQSPQLAGIYIGRANTSSVVQAWSASVASVAVGATYRLWCTDPTGNDTPGLAAAIVAAQTNAALLAAQQAAAEVLTSFTLGSTVAFSASFTVVAGQIVTADAGKFYVVLIGGTDAASAGPAGTTAQQTVGGITYLYVGPNSLTTPQSRNDAIVLSLVHALIGKTGAQWVTNTYYIVGDIVLNGGNYYLATQAGESAAGPAGTGAIITDGTVIWTWAGTTAPVLAVTTPSATGSAGSKSILVTANARTNWIGVETNDPTLLTTTQGQSTDASLVADLLADLNACAAETNNWYGLLTLYNSQDYVIAAAGWIAGVQKLYVPATSDTTDVTTGSGPQASLGAGGYGGIVTGIAGFFHPRASQWADAAEMGRWFNIQPGGDNWLYKTLSGVTPGWANGQQLTSSQIAFLKLANANYYGQLGSRNVVLGQGKCCNGQYIDTVRFMGWYVSETVAGCDDVLIENEKVAFTDTGIAQIVAAVTAVNSQGVKPPGNGAGSGGINPGSPPGIAPPSVSAPSSGSVPSADRISRTVNGVVSSFTLAGAIDNIVVNVNVSQ